MNYGKHICKTLKAIRSEIASANGIDYTPIKCDHKGDCAGTCPACESEMRWLERQLINRKSLGKAVAIVGLSLALSGAAYAATPQNKKNLPQRPMRPGGSSGMNRPPQRTAGVVRRPEQPKDPIRPIPPGKGRPPKKDNNTTNSDSIYTTVDHAATFPGGDEALGLFIKQHLSVPESILAPIKEKNRILNEHCVVKCLIENDGSVGDAVIEQSTSSEVLDNEALRVVKELPKFKPARILDFPVRSWIMVPVEFIYDSIN